MGRTDSTEALLRGGLVGGCMVVVFWAGVLRLVVLLVVLLAVLLSPAPAPVMHSKALHRSTVLKR